MNLKLILIISWVLIMSSMAAISGEIQVKDIGLKPSSLVKSLEIADKKARSLGYDIDHYYFTITEQLGQHDEVFLKSKGIQSLDEGSFWKFYYGPKVGYRRGGDLTIYINSKTYEVIHFWKGE